MTKLALPPEVADHGGSLTRARRLFPLAPEPWIDLSTGINPHSYPRIDIPEEAFTALPETSHMDELVGLAAKAYRAPSSRNIVAAPGTQILLPMVMAMPPPGRAAVLSPTYAEHARAAKLRGHSVTEPDDFSALFDADLAVVVNPNNPDGRVTSRAALLELARHMAAKGGLLVVDEAFMEVGPQAESVAGDVGHPGLIVLRSFGKFYGLAGLRLGFAIANTEMASLLTAQLGPWAVSGPALEYGIAALGDETWHAAMRARLSQESERLDSLLAPVGLTVTGGTSLYRFVHAPHAAELFGHLGQAGVLVRRFDASKEALRFGLPGTEYAFTRLQNALASWRS